jgi:L-serine dehydratase
VTALRGRIETEDIRLMDGPGGQLVEVKSPAALKEKPIAELCAQSGIKPAKVLAPVLPVLTPHGLWVPFITCQEMLDYNRDKNLELWELAVRYESARGQLSPEDVFQRMAEIVHLLQASIREGLKGTVFADRILKVQSGLFQAGMQEQRLLDGGMLNRMILYVTAMMEAKSSLGVIVAAPTAGSCGALPGACLGAADALGLSTDEITKAMLAAGLVGIFIAAHATFAAEVGGCQAECGAGSGMAAAALVTLAKGTVRQATDAASMALQNILGMICDPVAGRVEVPCLGKNVLAASNALACANMALAGYDAVIPFDEVIEAMDRVGKSLPHELRCTALGGLSISKTSRMIEDKLKKDLG